MMSSELDRHVKIYDQMRDLETVLAAFAIFQNSITSPKVVERIAWELFEDSARQNIKLLEVRFSPDWAFHGHNLDWDEASKGFCAPGNAPSASLTWRLATSPSPRAVWDRVLCQNRGLGDPSEAGNSWRRPGR